MIHGCIEFLFIFYFGNTIGVTQICMCDVNIRCNEGRECTREDHMDRCLS